MPAEARLALIILAVSDIHRSVRFYRQAFGWPQTVDEAVYTEFAIEDGRGLALYQRESFGRCTGRPPTPVPEGEIAGTELYFFVDDLPAAIGEFEAAGARVLSRPEKRDWGHEAAYFADPDGNVIVLACPLATQ